jgi:hypothetical protein
VLKHLEIDPAMYFQTIKTCPYNELSRVQEEAMLEATLDWIRAQSGSELVNLPMSRDKVIMAETNFQVRVAALQNDRTLKDQSEVLVERFKIEDASFFQTGVEVEHFIMLRHEDNPKPAKIDEQHVQDAFTRFEEQPFDLGTWPEQKRAEWFDL